MSFSSATAHRRSCRSSVSSSCDVKRRRLWPYTGGEKKLLLSSGFCNRTQNGSSYFDLHFPAQISFDVFPATDGKICPLQQHPKQPGAFLLFHCTMIIVAHRKIRSRSDLAFYGPPRDPHSSISRDQRANILDPTRISDQLPCLAPASVPHGKILSDLANIEINCCGLPLISVHQNLLLCNQSKQT